MIAREESSSPHLEVIASKLEDLTVVVRALADRDGGGAVEPESPEEEGAERKINIVDVFVCWDAGVRAKNACLEAGGEKATCYAAGVIAEANCLKEKVDEPEKKG